MKDHHDHYLPVFMTSVALFLLGILLGYGLAQRNYNETALTNVDSSYITPSLTPTPTEDHATVYKTRFYNPKDKLYERQPYPNELISVNESDLIPLSCSDTYTFDGQMYYDNNGKPQHDRKILDYKKVIESKHKGMTLSSLKICNSPGDQKIILMSALGPCGGGCTGIPYVGTLSSQGVLKETEAIHVDAAYFQCNAPLQLTLDNVFYFGCGGGDGPGGSVSIYRTSLNTFALKQLAKCDAGVDENGKSYVKCQ
jgi:hypothetical protein